MNRFIFVTYQVLVWRSFTVELWLHFFAQSMALKLAWVCEWCSPECAVCSTLCSHVVRMYVWVRFFASLNLFAVCDVTLQVEFLCYFILLLFNWKLSCLRDSPKSRNYSIVCNNNTCRHHTMIVILASIACTFIMNKKKHAHIQMWQFGKQNCM